MHYALTSLAFVLLLTRVFAQCPNGYQQQFAACYKYFNNQLSTLSAEEQCVADGGHLVSIHSQAENDFIVSLSGNVPMWIGLNEFQGVYSWLDNSAINYFFWYQGFPNVDYGTCVALLPAAQFSGHWMNRNCQEAHTFVCKTANGVQSSPAGPTVGPNGCPTPYYSTYGTIQSSGYPVQYGNNLNCDYHLSVAQGSTVTIKFSSDFATEKCCDMVTLYDGDTSLSKVIARISGRDGANQQFTSSTNIMLVNFHTDASNTDKGWSAYFSATGQPGQSTTPSSGNCGFNWSYDPITQYCYQLNNNENAWDAASSICRANGAQLVSIHTDQQNSFVMNLIANTLGSVDYYVWSGLTTRNQAAWSDNTRVNYLDWLPGEPNSNIGYCMALQSWPPIGWRVVSCSATLPFVCEKPVPN